MAVLRKAVVMSRDLMTFIVSLAILSVATLLLILGTLNEAAAVGLISAVAGYWISEAGRKANGKN